MNQHCCGSGHGIGHIGLDYPTMTVLKLVPVPLETLRFSFWRRDYACLTASLGHKLFRHVMCTSLCPETVVTWKACWYLGLWVPTLAKKPLQSSCPQMSIECLIFLSCVEVGWRENTSTNLTALHFTQSLGGTTDFACCVCQDIRILSIAYHFY